MLWSTAAVGHLHDARVGVDFDQNEATLADNEVVVDT